MTDVDSRLTREDEVDNGISIEPEAGMRTATGSDDDGHATVPFTLEPTSESALDPFDPASLRLGQDFGASLGVKKVITVVPCRKPNNQEFVRVRPGEDWRIETAVFEDKINRESYLVERGLWNELIGNIYPVCLFTAVSRQGNVFLWQVKLPGADGRTNAWYDSALSAARLAETRWVRVSSNMPAGMYDVFEAASGLSEPEWPDLKLKELLRISFRDRRISDINHPLLRALRGEQ